MIGDHSLARLSGSFELACRTALGKVHRGFSPAERSGAAILDSFVDKLRNGVPELAHPFDRRARWIYAFVVGGMLATAILLTAFGFTVERAVFFKLPTGAILLAACGMLLRRYGHPRIGGTVEAVALVYMQGLVTVLLLFPLTAISLPFADAFLARADAAMGFHWPSFAAPWAHDPALYAISEKAYGSFEWQAILLIPLLFLAGNELRAWRFVTATAVAAGIAIFIYVFVPGEGPCVRYGLDPADFPTFSPYPWQFGPELLRIKEGWRVISLDMIFGLISFPSYHAAAAAMFLWAAWPLRRARWLFVVLNAAMLVATIVVGVHYLIDLVGGVLTGGVALWISTRLVRDVGGPDSADEAVALRN